MTYSRTENQVTVLFTVAEYTELLAILGFALVCSQQRHPFIAQDVGNFIENLNRTNPDFALYADAP